MYCKQCGHNSDAKSQNCEKCGAQIKTSLAFSAPSSPPVRWHLLALVTLVVAAAFWVVPQFFLRSELESMGPTDKLRFLRALDRSQYKRVGQKEFRLEDQTLIVIWDLRWTALPEAKQLDILRIVGNAWRVVGGGQTRFRVEGDDATVGVYRDKQAVLLDGASPPPPDEAAEPTEPR